MERITVEERDVLVRDCMAVDLAALWGIARAGIPELQAGVASVLADSEAE